MSTTLPLDSEDRKDIPLYSGPLRYFPAALAEVARVCKVGNDKHNPGQPMHHARGKSTDHADCILRHMVDMSENDGLDENGVPQVAYVAWRALALCQEWLEAHGYAPLAPGARVESAPAVGAPVPPAETALPPAGYETEYRPSELDYPGAPWRARRAGAALWFRGQTQKEALEHAGAVDPR